MKSIFNIFRKSKKTEIIINDDAVFINSTKKLLEESIKPKSITCPIINNNINIVNNPVNTSTSSCRCKINMCSDDMSEHNLRISKINAKFLTR